MNKTDVSELVRMDRSKQSLFVEDTHSRSNASSDMVYPTLQGHIKLASAALLQVIQLENTVSDDQMGRPCRLVSSHVYELSFSPLHAHAS